MILGILDASTFDLLFNLFSENIEFSPKISFLPQPANETPQCFLCHLNTKTTTPSDEALASNAYDNAAMRYDDGDMTKMMQH